MVDYGVNIAFFRCVQIDIKVPFEVKMCKIYKAGKKYLHFVKGLDLLVIRLQNRNFRITLTGLTRN